MGPEVAGVGRRAIVRDPAAAARQGYDLIVVGGGVYGVMLTLEAARRGLRPLLLERDDFGGATSWNSLRIVHGGLRYLQTLDLPRFFESVTERRWFLRTFPDLVTPLGCLMPLYGVDGTSGGGQSVIGVDRETGRSGERGRRASGLLRSGPVFRLAFAANDLLSWRRNVGVDRRAWLQRARVVGADEATGLAPELEGSEIVGGALWHDAVMVDSQRLLLEALRWAVSVSEGACCLNYVEVTELIADGGRARGVKAIDRSTAAADRADGDGKGGSEHGAVVHEFEAPLVINAAGPWAPTVARRLTGSASEDRLFEPSLAFNLYLRRPTEARVAIAVTPPRPGAPTYFLHPWKEGLFAGTVHAPWPAASGSISGSASGSGGCAGDATAGDGRPKRHSPVVLDFLNDLNSALPGFNASAAQIAAVTWGRLPATQRGSANLAVRPTLVDHRDTGGPRGLYSIAGVKFTTARAVAARTLAKLPLPLARKVRSGDAPRPPVVAIPTRAEFERLLQHDSPAAADLVAKLVADEAAIHLDDIMLRRTDWGILAPVFASDRESDDQLAAGVARLAGWEGPRLVAELRRYAAALRRVRGD